MSKLQNAETVLILAHDLQQHLNFIVDEIESLSDTDSPYLSEIYVVQDYVDSYVVRMEELFVKAADEELMVSA